MTTPKKKKPGLDSSNHVAFETFADLDRWLKRNHATATELWVRMYKKSTGQPSVDWNDLVIAGLTWGWIDGLRHALDERSFLQRLSPRRPGSSWSKKNCEHAERLIAEGKMQPSGLVHIEAARKDGRWSRAYAGSAELEIPEDFLAALEKTPKAKRTYATLNRANLFAIYHRLHTAKRPETREKRMTAILELLASGRAIHEPARKVAPRKAER